MRVTATLVHANALLLAEGARRLKISKVGPPNLAGLHLVPAHPGPGALLLSVSLFVSCVRACVSFSF